MTKQQEVMNSFRSIWHPNRVIDLEHPMRILETGDVDFIYKELGLRTRDSRFIMGETMSDVISKLPPKSVFALFVRIGETAKLLLTVSYKERIDFIAKYIDLIQDLHRKELDIKCKKGCSFCCYQQVLVTEDEAKVIADYLKMHPDAIDREQMKLHATWPEKTVAELDSEQNDQWSSRDLKRKRCPMLSNTGLCRIYDVRPIACRNHIVESDPSLCDQSTHPMAMGHIVESVNLYEIAILITALYQYDEPEPLAHAVMKYL